MGIGVSHFCYGVAFFGILTKTTATFPTIIGLLF